MTAEPQETAASARVADWLRRKWALIWRLIVTTVSSCLALPGDRPGRRGGVLRDLSVPPLIFALAGAIGYVVGPVLAGRRSRRSGRR